MHVTCSYSCVDFRCVMSHVKTTHGAITAGNKTLLSQHFEFHLNEARNSDIYLKEACVEERDLKSVQKNLKP